MAAYRGRSTWSLGAAMPKCWGFVLLSFLPGFFATPTLALAADDGCSAAYDDGTLAAATQRCERAARSGGPNAEFGFGLILWSGHNRSPDRKAALDWFRLAARQGHQLAQVMLGHMLNEPRIEAGLRNPVEGYAWFLAAGEREAAEKVLATLTPSEANAAESLGREYRSKFGQTRPPPNGA